MSIVQVSIESRADVNPKALRQYQIGGESVVGAHGNEPFAVRVRNPTGQRIEVKVSLDGTDVANGGEASADATGKRWIVEPYGNLVLAAWPEGNSGGAAFVFGQAAQSVAAHTHGNMSHQGVIAVAVFTEGAPARVAPMNRFTYDIAPTSFSYGDTKGGLEGVMRGGPAVGAGSFVEQRIVSAVGFREPRIAEIVRVRYMWWDDLQAALSAPSPAFSGIAGFPATRADPFRGISLGSTSRVDTMSRFA